MTRRIAHLYDKLESTKKNRCVTGRDERDSQHLSWPQKSSKTFFPEHDERIFHTYRCLRYSWLFDEVIFVRTNLLLKKRSLDTGIDAVLYQKHCVIDHYSKKLNRHQSKYTVTEKEMLAINLSITHWKKWLIGSKITVSIDNKNLLGNSSDYDKNCTRSKAELGTYNINMKHISVLNTILRTT